MKLLFFKANQLNIEQTKSHKSVIKQLQLRTTENERDCHCTFKSLGYNLLQWQTNDQNQNLNFTPMKKFAETTLSTLHNCARWKKQSNS